MSVRHLVMAGFAAALALAPATEAPANNAAKIIGGAVLGGVIVCGVTKACGSGANARQAPRQPAAQATRRAQPAVQAQPRRNTISSFQRQQNREQQTALNYFGFNAGQVDGVIGRGSRAATSRFQDYLGYSPTGQLTQFEREFLVDSYNRAISGGTRGYEAALAADGTRGLLRAYRDGPNAFGNQEQFSNAGLQQGGTQNGFATPQQPAANDAAAFNNTGNAPAPATPSPAGVTPLVPALALPNATTQTVSMAQHCADTELQTQVNGGLSTPGQLTNANLALSEQFCLFRGFAMAEGQQLTANTGLTDDAIVSHCGQLAAGMSGQVDKLAITPANAVASETRNLLLQSGQDPAQLIATGRICLGTAYRQDQSDVAKASALMLVALGEEPYGEVIGHHLTLGLDGDARPEYGAGWYETAFTALDQGAVPAVMPTDTQQRVAVMRAAIGGVVGQNSGAATGGLALPVLQTQ